MVDHHKLLSSVAYKKSRQICAVNIWNVTTRLQSRHWTSSAWQTRCEV